MKPTKSLALGALLASCALLTAQPASQLSGTVDPKPTPGAVNRYDVDGDGKMSESETMAMNKEMKSMAERRHMMMMKKYDKDGDGKMSDEETAMMKKDQMAMSKMRNEKMMKMYDKDGDGKMSDEESKMMSMDMANKHKMMMEKYDMNKNGMMDADEMDAAEKAGDFGPDSMMGDDTMHGQPQRKGSNAPSADD